MDADIIKSFVKKGELSSPAYILDKDALAEHMRIVNDIVEDHGKGKIELCYAMKANAVITEYMADNTSHVEVCSPGELQICKMLAIDGSRIIFSGVNKTENNIRDAVSYGADIITLESMKQYRITRSIAEEKRKCLKVLPRLTSGAQFGMSEAEVKSIIDDAAGCEFIDVTGIHYFAGTQKKNTDKNKEELRFLKDFLSKLREETGFVPKLLEYGAGLAVPYFAGDDFDHVYDSLKELVMFIEDMQMPCRVGIELGRYLAYNSMIYISTIEDIKSTGDTNICLIDGGIHHINYYGQNMAMRTPIIEHINMSEADLDQPDCDWKVCGSLCTFADILVRKISLKPPHTGDILAFYNAGAYSMTEAPALFLSRSMPAVYSYCKEEGISLIRDRIDTYSFNCAKDIKNT